MSNKTKERLNRLFTTACDRLAQDGCKLLPYDYVELHRLAVRAVDPESCGISMFVIPPVMVGRAVLQVPTIGAMLWWDKCGKDRYGTDEMLGTIAFAFMCVHGREREAIEKMYDREASDRALMSFRISLGTSATTPELAAGLDRLERNMLQAFSADDAEDGQDDVVSAVHYGDIVARMCAAYHNLDPHKVIFDLSLDECAALLRVAPSPMGVKAPESDPEFSAMCEFQAFVRKLRKERV